MEQSQKVSSYYIIPDANGGGVGLYYPQSAIDDAINKVVESVFQNVVDSSGTASEVTRRVLDLKGPEFAARVWSMALERVRKEHPGISRDEVLKLGGEAFKLKGM